MAVTPLCVDISFHIQIPPDVVLLFSYIRGFCLLPVFTGSVQPVLRGVELAQKPPSVREVARRSRDGGSFFEKGKKSLLSFLSHRLRRQLLKEGANSRGCLWPSLLYKKLLHHRKFWGKMWVRDE